MSDVVVATPWPLVLPDDDGIRPAGGQNECFYCGQPVGRQHALDCSIVTKLVTVRYIYEVQVRVPYRWDEGNLLFHRNESSSCADNTLSELEKHGNRFGCLCDSFHAEVVSMDTDRTPRRRRHAQKCACGHWAWDHREEPEGADSLYFGTCDEDDCPCEHFRERAANEEQPA